MVPERVPLLRYLTAAAIVCIALAAVGPRGRAGAAEPDPPEAIPPVVTPELDRLDRYDLSAGDASPMLEDPIEWRYDMALASFVMFMVLLLLLRVLAWRPILAGLDKRERSILVRIADAERTAIAAAEQLRRCELRLAEAHDEAEAIVAQARRDGQAVVEQLRHEGQQEVERERERLTTEIRSARDEAMREVSQQAADLAVFLAGQILDREMKTEDHRTLIHQALEQFPIPE